MEWIGVGIFPVPTEKNKFYHGISGSETIPINIGTVQVAG